jgi:hypothetical protein
MSNNNSNNVAASNGTTNNAAANTNAVNAPSNNVVNAAGNNNNASNANAKPPAWRYSEAKDTLRKLLENDGDGTVHSMDPKDVYKLSPLFQLYKYSNFRTNLKSLKDSMKAENGIVNVDEQALAHDRTLIPTKTMTVRGYPRWEGSDAKKLLRDDVKEKKHKNSKPAELRDTREEYKNFPLTVFRKHIYQEEYAQSGRSYWMHKKELKKQMKKKLKNLQKI